VCLLSQPYYVSPERLTVRRGDAHAPRTLAALRGRRVGTLPSSAAERILRAAGAEVATYEGGQDDVYNDLRLGRTDAVLLDETVSTYFGAVDPALAVLPDSFGEVSYAIAIRIGDTALLRAVDDALGALAREGTLRAIYERWGIWNAETAALLGDADPVPHGPAIAWDSWRAAIGFQPPFWCAPAPTYPKLTRAFAVAAGLTLVVSALAMALAIALGGVLAGARAFAPRPIAALAMGYVELFRGTPLLVQLVVLYFGLPELGVTLSPFAAGVIALGLNYARPRARTTAQGSRACPRRSSTPRACSDCAAHALRYVVLPQAVRISLPPMTNDFIALLKDSSLISVVTLTELTKTYSMLANATHDPPRASARWSARGIWRSGCRSCSSRGGSSGDSGRVSSGWRDDPGHRAHQDPPGRRGADAARSLARCAGGRARGDPRPQRRRASRRSCAARAGSTGSTRARSRSRARAW
jgi:polar amino acid transport system substrate-binding protein